MKNKWGWFLSILLPLSGAPGHFHLFNICMSLSDKHLGELDLCRFSLLSLGLCLPVAPAPIPVHHIQSRLFDVFHHRVLQYPLLRRLCVFFLQRLDLSFLFLSCCPKPRSSLIHIIPRVQYQPASWCLHPFTVHPIACTSWRTVAVLQPQSETSQVTAVHTLTPSCSCVTLAISLKHKRCSEQSVIYYSLIVGVLLYLSWLMSLNFLYHFTIEISLFSKTPEMPLDLWLVEMKSLCVIKHHYHLKCSTTVLPIAPPT